MTALSVKQLYARYIKQLPLTEMRQLLTIIQANLVPPRPTKHLVVVGVLLPEPQRILSLAKIPKIGYRVLGLKVMNKDTVFG